MRICVYCSSSEAVAPRYVEAATASGAEVLGVIPRLMVEHGVAYAAADRWWSPRRWPNARS